MGAYLDSVFKKDLKTTVLAIIFTVARIIFGWDWVKAGWEKLSWLSDGKANSAGLIKGMAANLAGPKVTRFDPLGINHLFAWIATHVFIPMSGLTDFLVVAFELLVGIFLIIGLRIFWTALVAIFLNLQYITAGSFNNFGYIWTDLAMLKFAKYAELIGVDGFIRFKKDQRNTSK